MRGLLLDLTPLRVSPAFRRLWWGLGVSNLGTQLTAVAIGLQVYAITDSTLSVGVVGVCALLPLLVLGLYGGALVDAYDRRRVALASSVLLWLVSIALTVQAALGWNSVTVLYALVAVQSAGFAVNNPARSAIIPRLLEPRLLPAANVLQTTGWSIAMTVGPLVGAFAVASVGFALTYAVDLVLFTAALYALWRLPDLPPLSQPGDGSDRGADPVRRGRVRAGGVRARRARPASVLEGLRYLATRPNVRTTFLVDLIAMIVAMPRVLWPAVGVVFLGGGAQTTGLLHAAFAAGSVVAGLLSGGLVLVRRQGRVIVLAVVAYGLSVAGFGVVLLTVGPGRPDTMLVGGVVAAMLLLALAGGSDAISAVFRQTILQSATPDAMRGRLQGVFIVVVAGGPRLGDLVLGTEAEWWGESWAAIVGGVTCVVLVSVVGLVNRRFIRYDATHPEP